jgi:hypothetical protein
MARCGVQRVAAVVGMMLGAEWVAGTEAHVVERLVEMALERLRSAQRYQPAERAFAPTFRRSRWGFRRGFHGAVRHSRAVFSQPLRTRRRPERTAGAEHAAATIVTSPRGAARCPTRDTRARKKVTTRPFDVSRAEVNLRQSSFM